MEQTLTLIKYFLPVYFLVYIAVIGFLKVFQFRKKYGINPRILKPSDGAPFFLQWGLYSVVISSGLIILAFVWFPKVYALTGPFPFLEKVGVKLLGLVVLLLALFLIRLAQDQMKASWRIGVSKSLGTTKLVDTGLFKFSRNPIAVGFNLTTLGFFLTLPNVFTLILIFANYWITSRRILLEEKHLSATMGESYQQYLNKTPRWF